MGILRSERRTPRRRSRKVSRMVRRRELDTMACAKVSYMGRIRHFCTRGSKIARRRLIDCVTSNPDGETDFRDDSPLRSAQASAKARGCTGCGTRRSTGTRRTRSAPWAAAAGCRAGSVPLLRPEDSVYASAVGCGGAIFVDSCCALSLTDGSAISHSQANDGGAVRLQHRIVEEHAEG